MNPSPPHIQPHPASDVLGVLWPGKRAATVLLRRCYGGATGGLPCGLCNSLILLSLRAYLEGGLALFPHDRSPSNMRNKAYHSMLRATAVLDDLSIRDGRSNPFRVDTPPNRAPRVAHASQPWAERSHPFRMTSDLPRI